MNTTYAPGTIAVMETGKFKGEEITLTGRERMGRGFNYEFEAAGSFGTKWVKNFRVRRSA